MRFSTAIFAALSIVLPVFATPAPGLQVEKYNGETTGKYIVTLKPGVSKSTFIGTMKTTPTHDWTLINGFASKLSADELKAMLANKDVESISEDGIMHPLSIITQDNAPWGLARLSWQESFAGQNPSSLDFVYAYDDSAGAGVDIYIVDTGVLVNHAEFEGRARWGVTFGGYPDEDVHGHGTHCAGTAAGKNAGVAKKASIIAVKVLGKGENGSGTAADIISGLDWVGQSAGTSGNPSIASLSLGGGKSTAIDSAVSKLTDAGVHVIAAAGNNNTDAGNTSPARAPTAIAVGASNIEDQRAKFSNYGDVVDIFAPGEKIISSWIGETADEYAFLNGTSMAAPHISGLVAYLITLGGNISPADMLAKVQSLSLKGVLKDIPDSTVNLLAQNGVDQQRSA